jgi:hypothetical protein
MHSKLPIYMAASVPVPWPKKKNTPREGNLNVSRILAALAILALCAWLSACKDVAQTGTGTGGNASTAGGIWTGSDPISGEAITGLIDEAGKFALIRSDGAQYTGTLATSGATVTSTFDGFTPIGSPFSDGSTHGTGTLTGAVQPRASITVTLNFTTDGGTSGSGQLVLTFNSVYDTLSSIAALTASYTNSATGTAVSLTSSGGLSWQDAGTGCVASGSVTVIDPTYNLYALEFTLANCQGVSAGLTGGQFTGFATLDDTASPQQLIMAAVGTSSGGRYSMTLNLSRN